jgi:DNA-binding XRE family transcriptional regulator/desulfoferrodoxin (superoxide reductase-like protein)
MGYVTGPAIKRLRERRGLTQKELGSRIGVCDKAISKWETGRGLPDVSLIESLAANLGASVAELLAGQTTENANPAGNLLRAGFNVCPICGNIVFSTGEASFSCHGIQLPRLEAEAPDEDHAIDVQVVDGEYRVIVDHPMNKNHFISFIAYITPGTAQVEKLYPEQEAGGRFRINGAGRLFAYCNRHGLFEAATPKRPRRTRIVL